MSPDATALILLSAAVHVAWNYLTKSSKSPRAFSLLKGMVMGCVSLGCLAAMPLRDVPPEVWCAVAASGAIHYVYILSLSTAYETGDISFVYPIARSAPALVPAAAFLILGESVSRRGAAGIAIVIGAVAIIQWRGNGAAGPGGFWTSIGRRDARWAFATLAAVIAYTLVDKAAMVKLSGHTTMPSWMRGMFFFMAQGIVCYAAYGLHLMLTAPLRLGDVWKRQWRGVLTAAAGTMISYSLILHVMQTEPVSYIVTLRQSSILLAVLTGWFRLKERYIGRRMAAAIAMIVGLFLVASAG